MSLSELISSSHKTVLLDGAMGTQLDEMGLEMGGKANISHPDAVSNIHKSYIACGVDIITTNTLTMNRVFIESHKVGVDVRDVNLAGARLAINAVHGGQYVLGDISSTGRLLKPYGDLSLDKAYEAFEEQAALLVEGGVDGFIIETMTDLKEALCALRACKKVADIPAIATMAFNTLKDEGYTIMGDSARDCAAALTAEGACTVGVNCGSLDPYQIAEIVSRMKMVTPLPIIVQPNAGKPRLVDRRTTFDMNPNDFAIGMQHCIKSGAGLVGGCCGTSPAHIQAIANLLRNGSR
ncbi:MAG: homocysteine S-methyltransferase family protein [Dehalococcoidales bacterium]|nr:MAG: homocysteine S-methyltransferase family protein [Dehalococcoidales bacterium]